MDPTIPPFKPKSAETGSIDSSPGRMSTIPPQWIKGGSQPSESSSTDEEVIIYDTTKAEFARRGISVTAKRATESAPPQATEHVSKRDQKQPTYHGGNANQQLAGSDSDKTCKLQPDDRNLTNPELPAKSVASVNKKSDSVRETKVETKIKTTTSSEDEATLTKMDLQEQLRWYKIHYNMHHNGLLKSPFAPKTYEEYLNLRYEAATTKHRAYLKQHEEAQQDVDLTSQLDGIPKQPRPTPQMSEKLVEISNKDNLSLVNARDTAWGKPSPENGSAGWPTQEEYKGGRLPPPRVQSSIPWGGSSTFGPNPTATNDSGVPPEYRKLAALAAALAPNPLLDGLTTEEASNLEEPTEELRMEDVNGIIRGLLEEIYEDDKSAI